jgi:hypothetical protein
MLEWFLRLIGVGDEFLSHLDEAHLAFQFPTLLGVGLVLLIPVSFFIFWWQRQNLGNTPALLRIVLSLTRVAVLVLLIGVLSGPYLKIDHESERKPIVGVLFDHSQSMQLPAGPFESEAEMAQAAKAIGYSAADGRLEVDTRKSLNRISRAKLAQSAVEAQTASLLDPLVKKYDVRFYSFARDIAQLGVDPAHPKFPEPPNPGGSATHLGDAIAHALDEAAGRQVAGVVVFTDGQNTGGRAPSEVAHAAAAAGAPLFAVPTGSTTRLRDVAIVDVFTTGLVSVGDTARVAVTLESQGFDNRPVKVELREGETRIDSKDLVLRGSEQQQVELTFQAKKPGAHYFTVHVPPMPEEPDYLRANNTDTAYVRVSEEKLRVLYLDGLPRWDFRYLKNAVRRDHGLAGRTAEQPDIVLEAEWRRRSPSEQADALPRTLEQLAEYHTVVIGDVSPKLLTPQFAELLDKAVREKGVGLIVAAGPLHMPHEFDDRLLNLLPVKLRRRAAGVEAPVTKLFRLELAPEGAIHEAMRFYDDPGRNQNAWTHLPPYFWCAAVDRAAPAASVLVWNPSVQSNYGKLPLVAHHYAGQGRVLFVGTDETWRWRQNVGDRFFYKFWGQGIRFVARRDTLGAKKSWLEVRPIRAQPGEQGQIGLMAYGPDGSPRTEPAQSVRIVGPGSADLVQLAADSATKGRYTGKFPLSAAGEYRVTYEPGRPAEPIEARLRVLDASEELRHPNVNRPALELLAGTSGGKVVELHDLGSIPEQLKGESKLTQMHREASLWDNWLTLALLIFIYCLDVGLRRLAGLS